MGAIVVHCHFGLSYFIAFPLLVLPTLVPGAAINSDHARIIDETCGDKIAHGLYNVYRCLHLGFFLLLPAHHPRRTVPISLLTASSIHHRSDGPLTRLSHLLPHTNIFTSYWLYDVPLISMDPAQIDLTLFDLDNMDSVDFDTCDATLSTLCLPISTSTIESPS